MTDQSIFPVPPEIAAHAILNAEQRQAWVERAKADPEGYWRDQAKRVAWMREPTRIRNASFTGDVSIKWYEDGTLNASATCLDRHLAERPDQVAIIWEGDDPSQHKTVTYRELHEQVCRLANALRSPRRQARRPGHDLPADGDRGRGGHARLRPDRRDPRHRVRRLLAGQPGQPHPGLRQHRADHRRRGPPRRPQGRAEDQRRRGAQAVPDHPARRRRRRSPAATCPCRTAATTTTRRSLAAAAAGLHARGNGRRGPAVHPLYLRQHRQAEGRRPHHRRLPGLGRLHPPARLRLPARRGLLVHRRRRLGHRPHLYRLRPARQRRDHADVRGHPLLPRQLPLLAGRRQAPGQHLLHRAHRDPLPDARRRGPGEAAPAARACASSAASASRSIRRPGSGITGSSATAAARSSTPGGRPRPAAS